MASPKEVSEKNINIGGIKVVSSKYWYFKAYWLILNYSIFGFLVLIAFTTYDQSSDFPNILFSAFHFEELSNMPKIGKKLKKALFNLFWVPDPSGSTENDPHRKIRKW